MLLIIIGKKGNRAPELDLQYPIINLSDNELGQFFFS